MTENSMEASRLLTPDTTSINTLFFPKYMAFRLAQEQSKYVFNADCQHPSHTSLSAWQSVALRSTGLWKSRDVFFYGCIVPRVWGCFSGRLGLLVSVKRILNATQYIVFKQFYGSKIVQRFGNGSSMTVTSAESHVHKHREGWVWMNSPS